jgi:hypothetical protein
MVWGDEYVIKIIPGIENTQLTRWIKIISHYKTWEIIKCQVKKISHKIERCHKMRFIDSLLAV